MSTKFNSSQMVNRSALPMVGSSANEGVDSIFSKVDPEISKLFEDRNALLTGGGVITNTSGTSLAFTANFILYFNSNVAGAAPYALTIPTSGSPWSFAADGRMTYVTVNRTAQTLTVTTNAASLPAVTSANQEIFLIAKRVGTSIYFVNGFAISSGSSGAFDTGTGANTALSNLSSPTAVNQELNIPNGSAAVPSLAFTSDRDGTGTGLYRVATNSLGFSANGVGIGQYSSSGSWILGPNTANSSAPGNTILQVAGPDSSTGSIVIDTYGGGSSWFSRRSNGTATSLTQTLSGDLLAQFIASGYGTSQYSSVAARIQFTATENFTNTANGTKMLFYTTPNTTNNSVEGGSISNAGAWLLGPATGAVAHSILGTLSFNTDESTQAVNGLRRSTTNTLAVSTNSVDRLTINTASVTSSLPILTPSGTVSAPSIAFSADSDGTGTGLYRVGANSLGFSANGVNIGQYSSAGLWTIGPAAGAVGHSLLGTLSFDTTEATQAVNGLRRSATNTLALSTNSVDRLTVDTASVTSSLPVLIASGTVTAPSLAFSADSDGTGTGIYRVAADTLGFATNGVARAQINPGGTISIGNTATDATLNVQTSVKSNGNLQVGSFGNTNPSGFIQNIDNTAKSISLDADPNNVGASSQIVFRIDGSDVGSSTSPGAWVLGPAAGGVTHTINTNTTATGTAALTMTNGPGTVTRNPVGYITINVNGTNRVIPFFATS